MQIDMIIGLVAGGLTTFSLLPQVVKAYRSKHTKDLSLATFMIFTAGVSMWLIYGFMIRALPVILANSLALIFAFLILRMKIKYG